MTRRAAGGVSEKVEQQRIVRLLRTLPAAVYTLGTTRRRTDYPGTMQSPGVPDLLCFLPRRDVYGARLLMIEVKTARGVLSPAQHIFREQCRLAGIAHVVGPLDAVVAWLTTEGYLR